MSSNTIPVFVSSVYMTFNTTRLNLHQVFTWGCKPVSQFVFFTSGRAKHLPTSRLSASHLTSDNFWDNFILLLLSFEINNEIITMILYSFSPTFWVAQSVNQLLNDLLWSASHRFETRWGTSEEILRRIWFVKKCRNLNKKMIGKKDAL